ncbi:hypothetical protein GCM10028793_18210 [Nocardiopsis oceani]
MLGVGADQAAVHGEQDSLAVGTGRFERDDLAELFHDSGEHALRPFACAAPGKKAVENGSTARTTLTAVAKG